MDIRYLKRERLFVYTSIAFISINLVRLIRHDWLAMCGRQGCFLGNDAGSNIAPEAYRVGIPIAQRAIAYLIHTKDGTVADSVLQLICSCLALYFLYRCLLYATHGDDALSVVSRARLVLSLARAK